MKKVWGIFWFLMALLGCKALQSVLSLPSESRNAVLFGMSAMKLIMCAGITVGSLCFLAGAILCFADRSEFFSTGKAAGIASYILTFLLVLGCIFLTPPVGRTAFERSLSERLTPAAYWTFAFIIFSFPLHLIQKRKLIAEDLRDSDPALIWGFVFLVVMAAALFFALSSGTGLDPISGTFYRQGVPLLEGFIAVPLLILYPLLPLFIFLFRKNGGNKNIRILSVILSVLIWAAAVYFWQNVPFEGRSYFAPALRAPNYNFYPASDAENYDLLAQSILTGNGFRNGLTVVRPVYAAFLALLHLLFGNDYMHLTNGQILLLALIPVMVFLIGKELRHPEAGLLAAVWTIWREIYTIRMTPYVQVSNSRLLMSDLPTMLLTAAVILSTVVWAEHRRSRLHALICGGLIGVSMLLRTQCFVLIPAVWEVFMFSKKKRSIKWMSVLISTCGLLLVFMPWYCWGKIHPNNAANADVSEGQYLLHLYQNAVGDNGETKSIPELILRHSGETFHAAVSHFLNNEISSLLILPVRLIRPEEAGQYFYEDDLFWYRENARETIEKNLGILSIYLIIISIGFASSYRKAGFTGLAPLLVHVIYNLGNALAMTSGFRFILPVDWILYFYFAFGCAAILKVFCRISLFGSCAHTCQLGAEQKSETKTQPFVYSAVCILLLFFGLVLPFCDSRVPLYPEDDSEEAAEHWKAASPNAEAILSAFSPDDLVFLEGRAFYPRFYEADDGDSGGSSSAKRGLDMDRMVWMFHSRRVHVLCLPVAADQKEAILTEQVPDPMDVLVAGIPMKDYIQVIEMIRLDGSEGR